MNSMKKLNWVFAFSCILVFVWCSPAFTGVPSPVPGPEAGPHTPEHQIANLGDFKFENGEVVMDFKVSYVTHGKLSEKKDNVILIMHSAWGTLRQMDFLIGPGKALDTDKYFIVATDRLGNPSLIPDITTGPTNSGLKMGFPRYTIRDEVNLEYKLLNEYLGFDHILAALGPSIGGLKAYQFGVSYPGYVSGLIPIAGTPATNFLTKTVTKKLMAILELDSGWHGGNYETNPTWALETLQWHWISWLYTPQFFVTDLKTKEAYFKWQNMWQGIIRFYPQDARDVYYTIQAWAGHDVGDTPGFNGDVRAALQSIQAKVLIIGAKGDMFFTREESMFAKKAIPKATYVEIDNNWGHINCVGWEPGGAKIIDKAVSKFLSNLVAGVQ